MSSPDSDNSSASSSDSGLNHPPGPSKRRSTRQALKRSYEHPLYTEIDEDEEEEEVSKILAKSKGSKRGGGGGGEEGKELRLSHPPKPIPRPPENLPVVPPYFTTKYPQLESNDFREIADLEYQKKELKSTWDILWEPYSSNDEVNLRIRMNLHFLMTHAKADLLGDMTAPGRLPVVTMDDDKYVVIRFTKDVPTFEIHHLPSDELQGMTPEGAIGLVDGEILQRSKEIYMTILNRQE